MRYLFCFLFFSSFSHAQIADTLYILRDTATMGTYSVNRCVFKKDSMFQVNNDFLKIPQGTSLTLTIINLDTLDHELAWWDETLIGTIPPGNALVATNTFNDFGTYGIQLIDPVGSLLGAYLPICVGFENKMHFLWNIWEMDQFLSFDIVQGAVEEIPADFRPDIYTINGLDYPNTTLDTLSKINGSFGDSLYISIINAGNMAHTFHFHGFHVDVLQIEKRQQVLNWKKDSLPFVIGETATVMFFADKLGHYPVHDHNLISVLTQGGYPGGMITMIEILP